MYLILLSCMFYRKIIVHVCYVHCHLHFTSLMTKNGADHFKYEIAPSLRTDYRLKISQDMAMNRLREKGKIR